jgi:hypothetical protein
MMKQQGWFWTAGMARSLALSGVVVELGAGMVTGTSPVVAQVTPDSTLEGV